MPALPGRGYQWTPIAPHDDVTALVLDVLVLPLDDQAMNPVDGFGQNVRDARAAKGWTQEELARRAGLTTVQISRIERGVREIRLTTLLRLLAALEAKPEVLLEDLY